MNNKIDLTKFGFRADFDWETRFDLKTNIGDYLISTVDLGIDHSFGFGRPLYYETMIFDKNGDEIDFNGTYQERYSTEEEAREGHKRAIKYVKDLLEEIE